MVPPDDQERIVGLVAQANDLLGVVGAQREEAIDAAITALDEALALLLPGQRSARGTVLMNLGVAYRARLLGDPADNRDRAVDFFRQALDLRDRQSEPAEWARVQNGLGVALHECLHGDPLDNGREAHGALEAALDVRRQLGDADEQAISLSNLANVESRLAGRERSQHVEDAIAHYREALELLHPDNHETRAAILLNLSFALLDRSVGYRGENIEQAVAALERALTVGLDEGGRGSARLALASALGLRTIGAKADNLERAIGLAEEELDRRSREESPERQAAAANGLGILYGRRIRGGRADNLERAVALHRTALAVYSPERYPRDRAGALNNLATALRARHLGDQRGNEEETIRALREALVVYTRADDPYSWAGTMSNLGTALFERRTGDLATHIDGAIKAYEQALEVRTENEHPWDWAATRFNLGQALWRRHHRDRSGDLLAAANALKDSLRVRTPQRSPDEWAASQSMLAVVLDELAERGEADIAAAERAYRRALEVYQADRFPFEARANANNLAGLLLREDRAGEALAVAREGLRAAELLYLAAPTEEGREVELDDNARLYRIAAEAAMLDGQPDAEVFALAEAGRARLLVDWLAAGQLPTPATLDGEDLHSERNLALRLRDMLHQARELGDAPDREGAVAAARQLREELNGVWARLEGQPGGAGYVALRRGQPATASQLQSWLDGQPGLAGMVVLAPLRERPVAFVAASGGSGVQLVSLGITHEQLAAHLQQLHREVVELRGPLPADESWTAVGEAVLAPALAMLPDELDVLYLVPYGALHGVPWHASTVGGSALVDRVATTYLPGAGASLQLTLALSPPPGSDALVVGDPLGDLPAALAEAETVANQLGVRPLLGSQADRAAVLKRLGGAAWAHYAAHGVYEPNDPMGSGVELADGRLTARDMLGIAGAPAVVLSTCESGRQTVAAGDELWGLARALIYPGTTTAVLSLWRVDDHATEQLMRRFYAELANPTRPGGPRVAGALRRAMLDVRKTHPHSYLWAAFTVFGSPW
jgi:CHAT domain-containing protein